MTPLETFRQVDPALTEKECQDLCLQHWLPYSGIKTQEALLERLTLNLAAARATKKYHETFEVIFSSSQRVGRCIEHGYYRLQRKDKQPVTEEDEKIVYYWRTRHNQYSTQRKNDEYTIEVNWECDSSD